MEALAILRQAREETGLPIVTELLDPRQLEDVAEVADVIQIGARNMQNFLLLSELGRVDRAGAAQARPVGVGGGAADGRGVRGQGGNERIILCERGIRTFERSTRYTLDLGSVAVLKDGDPSAGDRRPIPRRRSARSRAAAARAAAAVGADGIIVEVHPRPEEALCDGPQQVPADEFADFARSVTEVVSLMGREIG